MSPPGSQEGQRTLLHLCGVLTCPVLAETGPHQATPVPSLTRRPAPCSPATLHGPRLRWEGTLYSMLLVVTSGLFLPASHTALPAPLTTKAIARPLSPLLSCNPFLSRLCIPPRFASPAFQKRSLISAPVPWTRTHTTQPVITPSLGPLTSKSLTSLQPPPQRGHQGSVISINPRLSLFCGRPQPLIYASTLIPNLVGAPDPVILRLSLRLSPSLSRRLPLLI